MKNKKKNKYRAEFSDQVRKTLDDILDRKDKKTFKEITKSLQEIAENPEGGPSRSIIYSYNKDVLEKLNLYKGMKIKRISRIDYGGDPSFIYDLLSSEELKIKLEENLEDLGLHIKEDFIDLFGASIWKAKVRIFPHELKEKATKEIYFYSADYLDSAYIINLFNKDKLREFFIKAYAIVVG